ncbi:MAG: accB [Bacteroidota bacterium]|nr:accB [Bacteroidota bacterium]
MDIPLIKKLIQLLNNNNLGELTVEEGDLKITIRSNQVQVNSSNINLPSSAASSTGEKKNELTSETQLPAGNFTTIKAPMIGTFYRSSSPDKEPFVKVGDKIKKGDVLCVIEAMKLFNEIQSEVSGKIIKVMVDNAQAVEYDQPLFLVEG